MGCCPFIFFSQRVVYFFLAIPQHQLVKGFCCIKSAFRSLTHIGGVQIAICTFRDIFHFYNHSLSQFLYSHVLRRSDRNGQTFTADGWYSPDIGSTIIEQAGESGVIENIIHAHLFFIIFYHFAQGKHVCSIWIYVFYIGSEHEWLVEILEGFNAYFAGIVWYHIFQYIQGACAFISLLNNLAFEHELSG